MDSKAGIGLNSMTVLRRPGGGGIRLELEVILPIFHRPVGGASLSNSSKSLSTRHIWIEETNIADRERTLSSLTISHSLVTMMIAGARTSCSLRLVV